MFVIGRVIVMLDLWMNRSFGEKFVRSTKVMLAWDMLLKGIRIGDIATCIEYSKNALWASCFREPGGGASVMGTISEFQVFIDFQHV